MGRSVVVSDDDGDRIIAVYERVSSDKQGIARQESVRQWAAEMSPSREVVAFQDDGVSAFKVSIFDRPGGKRLCELIEQGHVEAVCVDAQDRLSRGDDLEWVTFRTLCETQGTRIVIDRREVRDDLGGRLESYLKALLAHQEGVQKSHNVKTGKRDAAKKGKRNGGGRRTYGYRQRDTNSETGRPCGPCVQDPIECDALRWAALDLYVSQGLSQSQVARRLNEAGWRTVTGRAWSQSQITQMFTNRTYLGEVQYRGEWFPGGEHEPLFTRDEWDRIQRARETRRRGGAGGKGGRPTKDEFLFIGGMLRCGSCGAPMRPHAPKNSQGRRYPLYRCGGARDGSTSCTRGGGIRREAVEGPLVAYFDRAGLSDLEDTRRAFEDRHEHDLAHVRALRERARRRAIETTEALDRIRADYKAGRIDADEWREFRAELEAEHAEAVAEADQFEKREAELHAEHAEQDIEQAALQHLADLRAALTSPVRDAETLAAVRLRLAELFDHFLLCRHSPDVGIGEQPTEIGDGLYLRAVLREDAFDHVSTTATRQPNRSLSRPAGNAPGRAPARQRARR
jgi:site-specific DNA recombinase